MILCKVKRGYHPCHTDRVCCSIDFTLCVAFLDALVLFHLYFFSPSSMPWVWILWLPLQVACVDCVALVDSFIILIQGECLERFASLTLTWITVQVTAIKVNKHKCKVCPASLTVDHSTVIKPAQLKINRERQSSSCHHLGHQNLHWFSSTVAAIKKWCTLHNPMAVCSLCGHFWWGSSGWIDWKQPASKWDQILRCKQEIVCSVKVKTIETHNVRHAVHWLLDITL